MFGVQFGADESVQPRLSQLLGHDETDGIFLGRAVTARARLAWPRPRSTARRWLMLKARRSAVATLKLRSFVGEYQKAGQATIGGITVAFRNLLNNPLAHLCAFDLERFKAARRSGAARGASACVPRIVECVDGAAARRTAVVLAGGTGDGPTRSAFKKLGCCTGSVSVEVVALDMRSPAHGGASEPTVHFTVGQGDGACAVGKPFVLPTVTAHTVSTKKQGWASPA